MEKLDTLLNLVEFKVSRWFRIVNGIEMRTIKEVKNMDELHLLYSKLMGKSSFKLTQDY